MKSVDLGVNWKAIHKDVFSFGVEGKFLYTSAAIPGVGLTVIAGSYKYLTW